MQHSRRQNLDIRSALCESYTSNRNAETKTGARRSDRANYLRWISSPLKFESAARLRAETAARLRIRRISDLHKRKAGDAHSAVHGMVRLSLRHELILNMLAISCDQCQDFRRIIQRQVVVGKS